MSSMPCSSNDVVLLPIPFTDLSSHKVRPAIVIGLGTFPRDLFVVPPHLPARPCRLPAGRLAGRRPECRQRRQSATGHRRIPPRAQDRRPHSARDRVAKITDSEKKIVVRNEANMRRGPGRKPHAVRRGKVIRAAFHVAQAESLGTHLPGPFHDAVRWRESASLSSGRPPLTAKRSFPAKGALPSPQLGSEVKTIGF